MKGLNRFSKRISASLNKEIAIAPLSVFRAAFGAIMFISTLRFILKGWVADFYITPTVYFPFYGFGWLKPLSATGMYFLFGVLLLSALCIMAGLFYRTAAILFFTGFSYVELIDKTNYLNHYYFVSLLSFLLILVPANRYFSLDVALKPAFKTKKVPAWTILILKVQLMLVYLFAGFSKLNADWLFHAMPLKMWLPAHANMPVIGQVFAETWTAYLFSWGGALFDLLIGFFLLNKRTRIPAYVFVIFFHAMTSLLFNIGMFPYIMMVATLVFFSAEFHEKIIRHIRSLFLPGPSAAEEMEMPVYTYDNLRMKIISLVLVCFFAVQVVLPFRYLLYPGKLYWTEEGFRFSWRVMLMEKGGTAFFYVKDPETGKKSEVNTTVYLTPLQQKMLVTQPDMILQFAHFLDHEYRRKGITDPVVTVESYVTLNGSGSRLFIDSSRDLSLEKENLLHKNWVLPFDEK